MRALLESLIISVRLTQNRGLSPTAVAVCSQCGLLSANSTRGSLEILETVSFVKINLIVAVKPSLLEHGGERLYSQH